MGNVNILALVFLCGHISTLTEAACDRRLPHCRENSNSQSKPECKPFWLIPGEANDCTKPPSKQLLTIDSSSVVITPNPVKLPGCFTISMKVDIQDADIPNSFLGKVEYDWFNLPQFSNLPCQNASANGCGGYGNNCYYCDICHNLEEIDKKDVKNQVVGQFKNIECPQKAGSYNLKREFCFNDFSDFDKDHDCQMDFLENSQVGSNYKDALRNLQQLGYGTVVAKFTLSHNASGDQQTKKHAKEREIEKTIETELEQKRQENNWALDDDQYKTFRNWYVQYRKDTWHKQDYLPWLLYNNKIGCMTVSFDVCDKQPTPTTAGSSSSQCL